jgi:hypothetical protein
LEEEDREQRVEGVQREWKDEARQNQREDRLQGQVEEGPWQRHAGCRCCRVVGLQAWEEDHQVEGWPWAGEDQREAQREAPSWEASWAGRRTMRVVEVRTMGVQG